MIFSNIVGRMFEWKGLHIYLEAIEKVETNDVFELIGAKEEAEEYYHRRLKRQIDRLGSRIVVRDFVEDIRNYYSTIDVVVHTAIEEDPLPTVLLEGLAMGKVLIATDVGGVREIVPEGYGNLVIPPGNSRILAEALEKVSRYDREIREKIARLNRQYAYEHFRLEKQIGQMSLLYRELCSK
ncbi:glycosyltransferase family 4 protein [Hydrogenimonas sp.]